MGAGVRFNDDVWFLDPGHLAPHHGHVLRSMGGFALPKPQLDFVGKGFHQRCTLLREAFCCCNEWTYVKVTLWIYVVI